MINLERSKCKQAIRQLLRKFICSSTWILGCEQDKANIRRAYGVQSYLNLCYQATCRPISYTHVNFQQLAHAATYERPRQSRKRHPDLEKRLDFESRVIQEF